MKNILIVDDEPDIIEMVRLRLNKAGFNVTGAESGETALLLIKKKVFDVVLLDLTMPIMDGWEVAQRIKQLENGKSLPIVLLTASRDLKHAKEAGIDRVLLKPFNFDEMIDVLLNWK